MMTTWNQEMGPSVLLVIEDDPAMRDSMTHALKREGHKVHTAPDGLSGVRMARSLRPDMILTDIILPDIDGVEVGRRIKADRPVGQIPIIAMTGAATPSLFKRIRDAGLLGPILKPFRIAELNRQIRQWLMTPAVFPL